MATTYLDRLPPELLVLVNTYRRHAGAEHWKLVTAEFHHKDRRALLDNRHQRNPLGITTLSRNPELYLALRRVFGKLIAKNYARRVLQAKLWFKERTRTLQDRQDLQRDVALVRLYGPRSREDLEIEHYLRYLNVSDPIPRQTMREFGEWC